MKSIKMPEKKQKLCFVLMPFSNKRKEVYDKAIKPACKSAGFKSLRVDELEGVFNINKKIIEHIFASDAIIADLTDWKPNVFYEMGVAHAIDNKTVMLIQKKDDLPFDVHSYSCIIYKQTENGLNKLTDQIVSKLESIEKWREYPSNPVQDYKPKDAAIPNHLLEDLQKELQAKEALLKKSVPKSEWTALKNDLLEKEKLLSGSVSKKEITVLQKQQEQAQQENESLQKEIQQLRSQLTAAKPSPKLPPKTAEKGLRSNPLEKLSRAEVDEMLKQKDFFDSRAHKSGKGRAHEYEKIQRDGVKLVTDQATGLTWQQSGSENYINFEKAKTYVQKLNSEKHAGFDDWRLPTLEEAMSLMETEKRGDLYIDPIFAKKQRWIWTSDKRDASTAWAVVFFYGYCYSIHVDDIIYYVRAVR